jgi:hypothetical protein
MLGRRRERPDGRQTCRGRRRCSRSGRPSFSPCWSSFDIHRRRLERWDGRKLRQAGLGRVEVRVREGALRLLLGKGRPGTRPRPCSETLCRGRPAASRMWRSLGHHHDEYHPTVLDPPRLIHDDSSSDTGRAPAMLARGQGRRKASCRPQPRGSSAQAESQRGASLKVIRSAWSEGPDTFPHRDHHLSTALDSSTTTCHHDGKKTSSIASAAWLRRRATSWVACSHPVRRL